MGGYVGIPFSYTPVEYIESSGTQYIDTGFKMSNNSKIVAKLSMADANIMTAVGVGGSYQSFSIQSYNGNYRIRWRSGTTSNIQVDSSIPIGTTPHIFEANSTNAKIDGTVIGNTNSYQFTESSNLFICAMSSNNSPLNLATGRIYYYQIYEYDVLVKNFIPVIDQDNVPCLYELVEGKFYYNKGSGTFTAGSTTGQPVIVDKARKITKAYVGVPASYTPVEYVENSGTQYIDTGFIPSYSTGFKLELKVVPSVLGVRYCPISNFEGSSTSHVSGELTANNEGRFFMDNGALNVLQSGIVLGENIIVWEYYNGNYKLAVNGVSKTGTYTASGQNTASMLLFVDRALRFSTFNQPIKLFYCKIYDGQTLVRDFIPAVNQDNVACLYEQIEGKLYYNEGSGTFTAGSTTGSPVSIGSVAREIQKGYVGVPVSYTPVDYIESSGTQYIDTGVPASATIKTLCDMSTTTGGYPFGVTPAQNVKYYGANVSATNQRIQSYFGTTNSYTIVENIWTQGQRFVLTANDNYKFYKDSTQIADYTTGTTKEFDSSLSITIFALNGLYLSSRITMKLYGFKMYDNGTLVRDFIPVVDQDNVACLYEQVEGKLYYNQGTGTFTAGSTTGQEVVLSPVARLCYSASALPDTALFLCHLDNNAINEITGNNTAPYSTSVTSYSAGKFEKAATIRATQVTSDYAASTSIFSLSDTNLPNAYNVLSGNASPVTATGWFKSSTNDGWIFAYGYGDFKTWGSGGAASYRNGIGVDASGGYLRAKIVYRTSSAPLSTASVITDVASSVYADGNWHHYAIEVDSTGMNFYFDGVYKAHINKPSNIRSDGFANRVHFSLGDEIMVCGELLYKQRNFTPPDKPYTI